MTAIRNYNNLSLQEREELELEPILLPRTLRQQTCLRCGNHFPGGLKRCTACGLEVKQAYLEPESALPWRGYERGVIECSSCGFETSDRRARRNLIQKCSQCSKVVYIPSGLYSKHLYEPRPVSRLPVPIYFLLDLIGAGLTRFSRSKARVPMAGVLVMLGLGLVIGSFAYKQQTTKAIEVDPPVKTYYNKVVAIRSKVTNALTDFQNDSGGMPLQTEYDDRRNPAKRNRFILAGNRVLGILEQSITQVRSLGEVPVGAETYQETFLAMLCAQQRFYAQLKDSIEQNSTGAYRSDKEWRSLWDTAFQTKEEVRTALREEMAALNALQNLALRPTKDPKL
ncbi:MAG: hypothetical protein WCS37_03365 [Chloroflexota bacterium]|nr:hypothetical protein [Chloroflexota bacterium]